MSTKEEILEYVRETWGNATLLSRNWNERKLAFRCHAGHTFITSVNKINDGRFCSYCNVEKNIEIVTTNVLPIVSNIVRSAVSFYNDMKFMRNLE